MPDAKTRKRIAILGGGVGAMTAAFELTETPDWQDKYEITVYQLGWRLGGKGASGRNRKMHDRIEEHGLHLWFGYYENAFNLIRRCYAALGRKPDAPLATWRDAFKPHSLFVLCQFNNAAWSQWHVAPPPIGDEVPGDGKMPPFWEVVDRLLAFLHHHHETSGPPEVHAALAVTTDRPGIFSTLREWLGIKAAHDGDATAGLHLARAVVQRIAASPDDAASHAALPKGIDALEHFVGRVRNAVASTIDGALDKKIADFPTLHRYLSLIELGYYMFKGIVADDVANKGFDQLDHLDLREWLASHGAGALALDSDALRVAYESIFAYQQGSYAKPNLAAGAGLRGLMRLCFTYKGGFAWKMQAGMGDTIFAPMYLVLRERGVKFVFFSRVKDLVPSTDGTQIEQIIIGRQATTPDNQPYKPLYDVKGLPCWPSEPFFDQLEQGEKLEAEKVDLESYWARWSDVREDTLNIGVDFDEVVLGISIGALPIICSKLIAIRQDWQDMVRNVEAIGTQAFQIWTKPDALTLRTPHGGKLPSDVGEQPVYGGFAQPHNTVADMSHLIERENWPLLYPPGQPGAIFYFCGPLAEAGPPPPPNEHAYPAFQAYAARVRAAQWLRTNSQFIMPGSVSSGYPNGFTDTFNFDVLYDANTPPSPELSRFTTQFWRANIDPSERYVLSTKASTKFRLRAGKSGFINLKLAGDWTFTALNYGCVEAAVMSGMEASRAICGSPQIIFGENFPKA